MKQQCMRIILVFQRGLLHQRLSKLLKLRGDPVSYYISRGLRNVFLISHIHNAEDPAWTLWFLKIVYNTNIY